MRFIILTVLIVSAVFGNESLEYFKENPKNRVLCKVSQYAYKIISQKNAEVVIMHEHTFFKLKGENYYLITTGCSPADGKREMLIF
jgi:hypothetical protein